MFKEKSEKTKKFGQCVGYVFSYFLFTIILYFILCFLGKISCGFNGFITVGLITLGISIVGIFVKELLK